MERFEVVKDIGQGNFGTAKLLRDKNTGELFAVKYIDRGPKIDENVKREIMNHRSLRHPNIIRFKEVCLTPQKLAIIMEYASGGELFEHICNVGRLEEEKARYFFQQLISGVSYCHDKYICHRDLKMENTLLDGSDPPRLKICDFGYSKSLLNSLPKSTVGTPAYIAPEVLSRKKYDGKTADVWSCGVTLYVMLVGAYPFEDPDDPKNFRSIITRIMNVQYVIPDDLHISAECKDLLAKIFVADPTKRITMSDIKSDSWFCKNLPEKMSELSERGPHPDMENDSLQSEDDILRIIDEAKVIDSKQSIEWGYHSNRKPKKHSYSDEENRESQLEPYSDQLEPYSDQFDPYSDEANIGTEESKEQECPDEGNHVSDLEPYNHEGQGIGTNESKELGYANQRNCEPYDGDIKASGRESKDLEDVQNVRELDSNSDVPSNDKDAV